MPSDRDISFVSHQIPRLLAANAKIIKLNFHFLSLSLSLSVGAEFQRNTVENRTWLTVGVSRVFPRFEHHFADVRSISKRNFARQLFRENLWYWKILQGEILQLIQKLNNSLYDEGSVNILDIFKNIQMWLKNIIIVDFVILLVVQWTSSQEFPTDLKRVEVQYVVRLKSPDATFENRVEP